MIREMIANLISGLFVLWLVIHGIVHFMLAMVGINLH